MLASSKAAVPGLRLALLAGVQEAGSQQGTFNIVQPGSSVATSLSEGESRPKHALILEVLGDNWRTIKHPLRTVRPFAFDSVSPPPSLLQSVLCALQTVVGGWQEGADGCKSILFAYLCNFGV